MTNALWRWRKKKHRRTQNIRDIGSTEWYIKLLKEQNSKNQLLNMPAFHTENKSTSHQADYRATNTCPHEDYGPTSFSYPVCLVWYPVGCNWKWPPWMFWLALSVSCRSSFLIDPKIKLMRTLTKMYSSSCLEETSQEGLWVYFLPLTHPKELHSLGLL